MARHADLAAVRRSVADAADRLTSGDRRVRAAHDRLVEIDRVIGSATGGVPDGLRRAAEPVLAFPAGWGAATAATAAGLPGPWVIVTTVLVVMLTLWAAAVAGDRLHRRRSDAVRRARPVSARRDLVAVHADLVDARVRLVSAGLRRLDPAHWRAAHLVPRIGADRVLREVAHADLLLCQAVDHLERCLGEEAAA